MQEWKLGVVPPASLPHSNSPAVMMLASGINLYALEDAVFAALAWVYVNFLSLSLT